MEIKNLENERKEGREIGKKSGKVDEKEGERSHLWSIFCFLCPVVCPCNYSPYFSLCFLLSFHVVNAITSIYLYSLKGKCAVINIKGVKSPLSCGLVDNFFLSPLLVRFRVLLVFEKGDKWNWWKGKEKCISFGECTITNYSFKPINL